MSQAVPVECYSHRHSITLTTVLQLLVLACFWLDQCVDRVCLCLYVTYFYELNCHSSEVVTKRKSSLLHGMWKGTCTSLPFCSAAKSGLQIVVALDLRTKNLSSHHALMKPQKSGGERDWSSFSCCLHDAVISWDLCLGTYVLDVLGDDCADNTYCCSPGCP